MTKMMGERRSRLRSGEVGMMLRDLAHITDVCIIMLDLRISRVVYTRRISSCTTYLSGP
jgi:hypothetical protein